MFDTFLELLYEAFLYIFSLEVLGGMIPLFIAGTLCAGLFQAFKSRKNPFSKKFFINCAALIPFPLMMAFLGAAFEGTDNELVAYVLLALFVSLIAFSIYILASKNLNPLLVLSVAGLIAGWSLFILIGSVIGISGLSFQMI